MNSSATVSLHIFLIFQLFCCHFPGTTSMLILLSSIQSTFVTHCSLVPIEMTAQCFYSSSASDLILSANNTQTIQLHITTTFRMLTKLNLVESRKFFSSMQKIFLINENSIVRHMPCKQPCLIVDRPCCVYSPVI